MDCTTCKAPESIHAVQSTHAADQVRGGDEPPPAGAGAQHLHHRGAVGAGGASVGSAAWVDLHGMLIFGAGQQCSLWQCLAGHKTSSPAPQKQHNPKAGTSQLQIQRQGKLSPIQ